MYGEVTKDEKYGEESCVCATELAVVEWTNSSGSGMNGTCMAATGGGGAEGACAKSSGGRGRDAVTAAACDVGSIGSGA